MRRHGVAVVLLSGVVALPACSENRGPAPSPTPFPAPDPGPVTPLTLSGVWHGYLRAAECLSSRPCDEERTIPFVLRALADNADYVASFELEEGAREMDVIMDVRGVPQSDGTVLFTGQRSPLDIDSYRVELRRLAVRIDPSTGLTGEIDLWKFPTFSGPDRQLRGRVTSATYQPHAPAAGQSVAGAWSGRVVIRSCSDYCPSYQDVGDELRLSLVLGQTNGSITGQMQLGVSGCSNCWLPVAGTQSGQAVSLSSDRFVPSSGRALHLERFDATLDALGRLAGRFVHAVNDRIAVSPFDVFSRLECEILWLKRD
jgi:hypothetical protein